MSFPFVIRETEPQLDAELGLLAPVPSDAGPDSVHPEPLDGSQPLSLHCTSVTLRIAGDKKSIIQLRDIRGKVTLTDGRITFACSKYDKGGGWFGGFTAVALNAGSKALAARRRRGKMLVAHLRYPWINAVYAKNKSGFLSSEQLRIVFVNDGARMQLDLELPKEVDAAAVATELIRRTATFRLRHDPEMTREEREQLEALQNLEPLVDSKDSTEMAGRAFPTHWPVSERSARFGLPAIVEPASSPDVPTVSHA